MVFIKKRKNAPQNRIKMLLECQATETHPNTLVIWYTWYNPNKHTKQNDIQV